MRILSIDPDPNGGSWVLLDESGEVLDHGYQEQRGVLFNSIRAATGVVTVVVEGIQNMGMPMGNPTIETIKNIGEFRAACYGMALVTFDDTLTRPKIKGALCGSARAKDSNVRAALLDLYPATGGGATPQIGIKSQPGPLFGIKADEFAALAVGLVWLSLRGLGPLAARDLV